MMYAALEWCTQNYSQFVDELRELCGGGVFQMPANISVMNDPALARGISRRFWQTPQCDAITRMKLFKLAWDMVGSEFAGRHQQYEKFYAGAPFIVRNHAFRENRLGRVQQGGRGSDGELRLSGGRRQESSGLAPASFDVCIGMNMEEATIVKMARAAG